MQTRLNLDPAVVREARELARKAGQPIVEMARTHTTVSVERAVLRLAGPAGRRPDGMPWVNRLVDAVRESTGLEHGVALPAWDALTDGRLPGPGTPGRGRRARQGAVPDPAVATPRSRPGRPRQAALARGIGQDRREPGPAPAADRADRPSRASRGST